MPQILLTSVALSPPFVSARQPFFIRFNTQTKGTGFKLVDCSDDQKEQDLCSNESGFMSELQKK